MSRAPSIQFTRAELRLIALAIRDSGVLGEWYRGYRNATRIVTAERVLAKVADADSPPERSPK